MTIEQSENVPVEVSVLRECGRAVLSGGTAADAVALVDDSATDWNSVVEFARLHRMDLLLFRVLKHCPIDPEDIDPYDQLEDEFINARMRNLGITAELVSLVETFESNEVPVLPYKGPAVASRAYGDISFRRYGDLDFLIDPADKQDAFDLLAQHGYREQQVKGQLFETVLRRQDKQQPVDLHTHIVPKYLPFQFEFGDLYERRTTVDLGSESVETLSTVDSVITQAIHGSKHHWSALEWALATGSLMQQVADPDELFDRAERMGCERMILLAVTLSKRLFDASFSQSFEERVDQYTQDMTPVTNIADDVLERVFTVDWVGNPHDKRTHLADFYLRSQLHSSVPMKLRYWLNVFTVPRQDDFQFVSLPQTLSPLYRVVRPVRLLYEYRNMVRKSL